MTVNADTSWWTACKITMALSFNKPKLNTDPGAIFDIMAVTVIRQNLHGREAA